MNMKVSPSPFGGAPRRTAAAAVTSALIVGTVLAGCGDDLLRPDWASAIDTVQLFSLARPELNLPSAFGFNQRRTYRVESATATGNWDIAVDTQGDEMFFVPPGALGISSRAGISMRSETDLADVRRAPTDTAEYTTGEAVPARLNTVYVIRTGQTVGSFGTRCVYFAKMQPVEIDAEAGVLFFRYQSNPLCNDTNLVPTLNPID